MSSEAMPAPQDARDLLDHDRRRERTLVWRGAAAAALAVALGLARFWWWS